MRQTILQFDQTMGALSRRGEGDEGRFRKFICCERILASLPAKAGTTNRSLAIVT